MLSWRLDGTEILNHEGRRLASARYGRIRPCSMKVSAEEKQEALALMVKAPEMWAALHAALPWLIRLGDFIGNGEGDQPMGRCEAIEAIRDAIDGLPSTLQQYAAGCPGCGAVQDCTPDCPIGGAQ